MPGEPPNFPEQEQFKSEIVHFGEEFLLFDPQRTLHKYKKDSNLYHASGAKWTYSGVSCESLVTLETGLDTKILTNIPFEIRATPRADHSRIGNTITPFDPELAYRIDHDDLGLDSRIKKYQQNKELFSRGIDFSKAPLFFEVGVPPNVYTKFKEDFEKEELVPFMKRLRFQVLFPRLAFETSPLFFGVYMGYTHFDSFYPVDTGPLPFDQGTLWGDPPHYMMGGFYLQLPADIEKLRTIRGKFILSDTKPPQPQETLDK